MTHIYDEEYVRWVMERKDDALKHARALVRSLKDQGITGITIAELGIEINNALELNIDNFKFKETKSMPDYGRQPNTSRADKLQEEVDQLKALLKSTQEALEHATKPD